jgi:predicted RNA methylase
MQLFYWLCRFLSVLLLAPRVFSTVEENSPIPLWHFRMLHDRPRNQAYYDVLKTYIVPNHSVVLDIGSGSGILSLFAASLGAKKVTAIELSITLCELAQQILETNHIPNELVDILNIHSNELTVGFNGSYNKKANILVSETLDSWIVGEGFLDTLIDIRARDVIEKDAIIIPSRATVYVQLIETNYRFKTPEHNILHFNFSPLTKYTHDEGIVENINLVGCRALSDAHQMLEFDFQSFGLDGKRPVPYASIHIPITDQGMFHGVVVWFNVSLDQEGKHALTNHPNATSHWDQMIRLFSTIDRRVVIGDTVQLLVAQISRRYVFAVADNDERILQISSACEYGLAINQDQYGEQQELFYLERFGDFNLWQAKVGDIYYAVAYEHDSEYCDYLLGQCTRGKEVFRVKIASYPRGRYVDNIPLYDYAITC